MGKFEAVFTIQGKLAARVAPQPQSGDLDSVIQKLGLDLLTGA